MVALCAGLLAAPAAAQTPPAAPASSAPDPTPEPSSRPAQQVTADFNYVFDGRSSLRAEMKQIYNRKDGTSVYFGEDLAFFHSTCGSNAFCSNVGGHDTDLRLGVQIANPDIFLALSSGNFAGNGASFAGLGFGLEKVARGEAPMELTASLFYFPSATGSYACPVTGPPGFSCFTTPVSAQTDFQIVRYSLGAHYQLGDKPFFVNVGIAGDNGRPNGGNAFQPIYMSHNGAYLGLGIKM